MKRIYILNEGLSSRRNGIGTYLDALLTCLKRNEVEVWLISFNADCFEFNVRYDADFVKMNFPFFANGDFKEYPQIISRFFRLYITDCPDNIFFLNYSLSEKIARMINRIFPLSKQVYVIHDFSWTGILLGDYMRFKQIIAGNGDDGITVSQVDFLMDVWAREKDTMQLVDKIVCLSRETFRILIDIYQIDEQKIYLIPNALPDKLQGPVLDEARKLLRKQFYIDNEEKIILFVGRATKEKGFDALIDALRIVLKDIPEMRLVVIGTLPLLSFAQFQDISSRIIYTGHISRQELEKWYEIADAGIIPSYTEQCTYVGIEMMMHGMPIITSNGLGMSDMFQDGVNAIVASIGKSSSDFGNHLAEALKKIFTSKKLIGKLRKNARLEYEQRYEIKYMQDRYVEMLKEF